MIFGRNPLQACHGKDFKSTIPKLGNYDSSFVYKGDKNN